MSSIISWNIRDLNWPNKQEDVKSFLQLHEVGLVGLLETKVKDKNVSTIARRTCPGWKWIHNIALNPNGRIWIAWEPRIYGIKMLSMADQVIQCHATQLQDNEKLFITFVYGMHHEVERKLLWNALQHITSQMNDVWCIL